MTVPSVLTINDWTNKGQRSLRKAGIQTAGLDVLIILEDVLNKNRAQLLAHPELRITPEQERILNQLITRRAKHEPLAYIRGKSEFYGREFIVNNHVLQPRPESETMIAMAIKVIGERFKVTGKLRIVDVGTGSGALAITTKLRAPEAEVIATDIDKNCLKVARQNAKKYSVDVKFLHGNLLEPLYPLSPVTYNLILANLPYVPDEFLINKSAEFEPRLALFGGADGLDLYRKLFDQIENMDTKPVFVLTESLPLQHAKLAKVAQKHGYKLQMEQDFIQLFHNSLPHQPADEQS